MEGEVTPILIDRDQPTFVKTPYVKDIIKRALTYVQAGFPIHFSGPSGTGKTTLAMYVAAQVGRPVVLIHGDEEFVTSDLVGGEYGYRRKKVVDNFIHSVLKTEEDMVRRWVDNRLTVACKYGFTLIYDEFTRSRPEANNALLSVLEEKILDLPAAREEESYLRVHPDFCAIFTSNPQEYAGVHKAQDALKDRMINIKLGHYDRETEIAITCTKSGISRPDAERIVDIVEGLRKIRKNGFTPTVRACIMIGKVLKLCKARAISSDESFVQACLDILDSEVSSLVDADINKDTIRETVVDLIKQYC
ncbi:hypothetical protein HKBW3S03_00445 [Candidatus Hakubella thermalkaliphila]|uniref:AAA+ ATPase domain-containing protein n=3 Tax=Candidatus Hakubella thermalkaliphila TaxID=2754717 RepID=A0A6V8PWF0_9ACTN|nr:gas vesicle protein GvpN [Candidatus Hakubella thermalkaliphila]MBT9169740.1 Denitrification regulatory protein NirQ [Actinomycetota bacterium]GFP18941.1 hypothetical protein HKBW3S03_00445 [Candidatus Hakubella thermalkaliphila]GFP30517.1 hypothetical protein HKBW3S34_01437 [Candidatus Hakubella thermalkaliphila]GFP36627.1 hypothetical protein HKBW3S44_00308 [Candidatus Hakubella thermalkaliphila]GFP39010.1 hypothetical protein HKBW3S47_00710 [Candidatus Hakubella thermalkaliphila]